MISGLAGVSPNAERSMKGWPIAVWCEYAALDSANG